MTGTLDVGTDATIGDDLSVTGDALITGYIGVNNASPDAYIDVIATANNGIRSHVKGNTPYYNLVLRRSLLSGSTRGASYHQYNHRHQFGVVGHHPTGWPSTTSAEIRAIATENHTSTARGTKWIMSVMKDGTTTLSTAMELGDDREAYFAGVDAHTTASAANVNVETTTGWLRRSTSARRYKRDIRPMPVRPGVFDRLQPVLYKAAEGVGGGGRDWPGLIAEDVADAGGEVFVTYNERGEADYVMYDRLVVLTIGEVQALKRRITELERRVNG
ncbi:MAG: tail fiber domain-containing protein [Anaerolineales bacterium]|nr:tail fiber domain-containing protein [Anaerolineales bacterium]